MKLKKRYIIGVIAAASIVYYFFTGGVTIQFGGEFSYVLPDDYDFHRPDPPKEERVYIPDDFYFRYKQSGIPTILYVWSVTYSRVPCSLNLSTLDPTYLQSHERYESFCVDKILVTYSNGKSEQFDSNNREFLGKEHIIKNGRISIPEVLTEAADVAIQLSGYTKRKDGVIENFNHTERYTYERYFRVTTIWEALASI